jgi:hypothetical protein
LEQRASQGDEEVREWSVRELGFIGAGQSVPVLAEAMADSSILVRVAAAEALGKIPGGESQDALIAGLQDGDPRVRTAVVGALTARGVPPVGEGSQKLFDALAELIKNEPEEAVRKKAKVLYDLIKPTLPPPSPSPPAEKPAPPSPGTEPAGPGPDTAAKETPGS